MTFSAAGNLHPRHIRQAGALALVISTIAIVYYLLIAPDNGAERLMRTALQIFWMLVFTAPIVIAAVVIQKTRPILPLVTIAVLFIMYMLLLFSPRPEFMHSLQWNWWGKSLEIVFTLLLTWIVFRPAVAEAGLTFRLVPGSARVTLIALLGSALFGALLGLASISTTSLETIAFQFTMPGLGEEFMFRLLMLGMLNAVFVRTHRLWGAHVGWGLLITSIAFGVIHMVQSDSEMTLQLNPLAGIVTGLIGFFLGWLRERSGSIVPSIIAHNLINGVSVLMPLVTGG
jgi:uncharacterized protein